jgi:hypothetical protein
MAHDHEAEDDGAPHDDNEGRHHVIQLRLQGEMYNDGTASMSARLAVTVPLAVTVSEAGRHPRRTTPVSADGQAHARACSRGVSS